ncbi:MULTISPECIES: DNA cytosine methyltransferase [unclassified Nocardia]|uniref:DNA cytosine methyltransferase n=1 Tax=unclassified Nocardia TaxID=2637762 RepID=UPI0021038526|nr:MULTISPECIES: DNA cytosine methyltransferase [unclassified Nocardia]
MLTLTDLFCGAGGSSTGAIAVPGVAVRMAVNHWRLAVETHHSNHPTTDHACVDISQVDPRLFPRTDLLWASPSCTNHSVARGRSRAADSQPDLFGEILPSEAAERSRATMWDVVRFAEHHCYRGIIVENVVDAAKWVMWPAWLQALELLGYRYHVVYLNSMHAQACGDPAPQSRDRLYVVAWRAGDLAPDFDRWTRPRAWCPGCDREIAAVQAWKNPVRRWGRYRAQYMWRCPKVACRNSIVEPAWLPAATAIDWSLRGERIGDRCKPLADKTIARIKAGLERFAADPALLVPTGGTRRDSAAPLSLPMATRTTTENDALLIPVEGRDGLTARPAAEPMRTMTTRSETALLVPSYRNGAARPVTQPHGALTTLDRHVFVVPLRNHNTAKPVSEPLDTIAAAGNHHGLATMSENVADCEFRMLEPREIARAMAFDTQYVILGNRREQVRQAGNAVTPPAARDLVSALAEALGHDMSAVAA